MEDKKLTPDVCPDANDNTSAKSGRRQFSAGLAAALGVTALGGAALASPTAPAKKKILERLQMEIGGGKVAEVLPIDDGGGEGTVKDCYTRGAPTDQYTRGTCLVAPRQQPDIT